MFWFIEDRLTHASALECTLWEDANKPSSFNFIAGNIKVDKVYESGKDYLESPTFMTHLRRHKEWLEIYIF